MLKSQSVFPYSCTCCPNARDATTRQADLSISNQRTPPPLARARCRAISRRRRWLQCVSAPPRRPPPVRRRACISVTIPLLRLGPLLRVRATTLVVAAATHVHVALLACARRRNTASNDTWAGTDIIANNPPPTSARHPLPPAPLPRHSWTLPQRLRIWSSRRRPRKLRPHAPSSSAAAPRASRARSCWRAAAGATSKCGGVVQQQQVEPAGLKSALGFSGFSA